MFWQPYFFQIREIFGVVLFSCNTPGNTFWHWHKNRSESKWAGREEGTAETQAPAPVRVGLLASAPLSLSLVLQAIERDVDMLSLISPRPFFHHHGLFPSGRPCSVLNKVYLQCPM
ncbi:hypothetical protein DPEC_G00208080 [Dallia pectoralis]|uniref:Uncharacterized protein n=1 Tax=Dallia pectoralis TaxID=75939 RepID=A0ACC2G5B4_DALPE|nr:hypothetical protein DPEC_G00208080 [Dallia pectoralis]